MFRSSERWTHKYVATRKAPEYGARHVITVTAGLAQLGDQRPYFSVTAEIRVPGGRCDVAGMCHDDVLKHFPKLAPIVALHLSDDDGAPLHAELNGWYWLAGVLGGVGERFHGANGTPARTVDECLAIFARHCRISVERAGDLVDSFGGVNGTVRDATDAANLREAWRIECDAMRPQWKEEAAAGVALLDQLCGKEGD